MDCKTVVICDDRNPMLSSPVDDLLLKAASKEWVKLAPMPLLACVALSGDSNAWSWIFDVILVP